MDVKDVMALVVTLGERRWQEWMRMSRPLLAMVDRTLRSWEAAMSLALWIIATSSLLRTTSACLRKCRRRTKARRGGRPEDGLAEELVTGKGLQEVKKKEVAVKVISMLGAASAECTPHPISPPPSSWSSTGASNMSISGHGAPSA